MATEVQTVPDVQLPASLEQLQARLNTSSHLLASSGDAELASLALQAAKDIFELGLTNESRSHPHLHPFLASICQPSSIPTRSKSKAKAAKDEIEEEEEIDPASILPYTPLTELTTSGLDHEQVWAQLELRAEGVVKVMKEMGPGEGMEEADGDEDGEGSDSEEDSGESDEEMTEEEWNEIMRAHGRGGNGEDGEDSDEEGDSDDDDSEDDEEGDSDDEENMIKWKDFDEDMGSASGSGSGSDEEDEDDEDEDEDDEDEDDEDDDDEADSEDLGSDVDIDMDAGSDDDDEGNDGPDDRAALFGPGDADGTDEDDLPGPSKRKRHPTLDDDFFSIDEFNRLTEEAEAGRLSSGRLGGDEEEDDDDLGDVGAVMLQAGPGDDDDIMYGDFFDTPRELRRAGKPDGRGAGRDIKGKGKGRDTKGNDGAKGKGKGNGVSFDDGAMDLDDVPEEHEEEEGDGRDVLNRFKGDLFDSDDEDAPGEKKLSTHEKRQLELSQQIAELESAAIGPKDWTLLGEATSRARPENSLLEEDLDFEQVAKVVPVITEERVMSLEEMIKKRIIDNNFDSTVRVRAYEPTPFLPSRYLELQDKQSTKSLAEIYEDEYQAAAAGTAVRDPRDEKLSKEHAEIEKVWGEICYKLDALSSLNFVPKAPKAQIQTLSSLPTTTLESALPPTNAPTSLLAPEEQFAPPQSSDLIARSELTPDQASAARQKRRREKKARNDKLGGMADLYGKSGKKRPEGGVKGEKERALKGLVKVGKGVTVLGKGDSERGKAGRRAAGGAEGDREGGKRLKL